MDIHAQKILEYDKIIQELAAQAATALGRERCEQLLPSPDADIVAARQADTEDAVKLILDQGVLSMTGVSDVRSAVARSTHGAQLTCGELMRVGALLRASARLRGQVPKDADRSRPVFGLLAALEPSVDLEKRLDRSIASEDDLADTASGQLASIRRRIRDSQQEVKTSLDRIIRSKAASLQDQLVTLRGDRYVVPVKSEHRGDIAGIVHDISSSGATLFIEPMAVVEINNRIRELMGLEREEIDRILSELSELVSAEADLILANTQLLAQIDFLMACGRLSIRMAATRPQINQSGRIRLPSARHPLIPKDRVVPIDFELGDRFKTLVITGPNTGGKTVTLKTCGLFSLMAMAGLQIPASPGCELSVFEDVLADIGDEQSIEQDLSTFSSHMRNIVNITNKARPGTLVLVDELGSGTDPSEGASLAIAILDHLREAGCMTVATTHYKELKGYALKTPGVENACCEFDQVTLRPTYRLLIGVPGVSNAFAISKRLGLSSEIIEQAKTLMSDEEISFEELIQTVEKSRSEAEQMRFETQQLHDEAKKIRSQLAVERQQLKDKHRDEIQKAREKAREAYQDALQEIEQMLDEIRDQQKAQQFDFSHRLATSARQNLRSGLNKVEGEIGQETLKSYGEALKPDDIEIGSTYEAPALGLVGKVVEGPDRKGQFILQSGAMKISVKASGLQIPVPDTTGRKKAGRPRAKAGKSISMDRKMSMSSEIKLLGQTVEEALSNLDKFIDDAVLGGFAEIRIVHGKGTGALRAAVQQSLKKDKRIKSFRLGNYGEGDSGVTLAELV